MHDAGDESVRQLDDHAVIPNIHDRCAQDLRIGVFLESVTRCDRPFSKLGCARLVRREHELPDQLMRFIVLNALESYRFARWIDIYLHLWKIEIERAVLETFAAQE